MPDPANPHPRPTEVTDRPNLSTEHQQEGDARLPSDTLDRGQDDSDEEAERKSSLTGMP